MLEVVVAGDSGIGGTVVQAFAIGIVILVILSAGDTTDTTDILAIGGGYFSVEGRMENAQIVKSAADATNGNSV